MITSSNSYHYIRNCVGFLLICIAHNFYAQNDLLMEAQKLCQEKKYEQAIYIIDKTVLHSETKDDPAVWHIRSFAYIQTFKQINLPTQAKTYLLDTAMVSVQKSIKLDAKKEYYENNMAFIKSASSSYYKLATILLKDSLNDVKADTNYFKYKKYYAIYSPEFDFKEKDIAYYTAKGSMFAELYIKNNFNQRYGDVAKAALLKVLELDPKNISANMNLGVLYYNQGATLMRMMDYDIDLSQLDVIQENAKKLFKQSLPFMIKVYELNPKESKALEGLEGIYNALLDEAKANEFKQKKEEIQKQK
ncbi:MAG: hypothetical protein IT237_07700 [Bacteroidia bacterium]|nr:hypothetical protein [Bacteroidia bacterium]